MDLTDTFQEIWAQVREERRQKLEKAVEEMITSNRDIGILVKENQFGVILSAELNPFVPFGTMTFVREETKIDSVIDFTLRNNSYEVNFGPVSPSAESGGST